MSLDCRHCSAFATCGVESPALLRRGEQCNQRRVRALKTPTLLDVFGVPRRLKTSKSRTLLPRVLDSKLRVTASPTRIVGGGIMSKRNLIIEEGSVEAMARLQKQDEEFCRRLLLRRAASVARPPSSPSHARAARRRLQATREIPPAIRHRRSAQGFFLRSSLSIRAARARHLSRAASLAVFSSNVSGEGGRTCAQAQSQLDRAA